MFLVSFQAEKIRKEPKKNVEVGTSAGPDILERVGIEMRSGAAVAYGVCAWSCSSHLELCPGIVKLSSNCHQSVIFSCPLSPITPLAAQSFPIYHPHSPTILTQSVRQSPQHSLVQVYASNVCKQPAHQSVTPKTICNASTFFLNLVGRRLVDLPLYTILRRSSLLCKRCPFPPRLAGRISQILVPGPNPAR